MASAPPSPAHASAAAYSHIHDLGSSLPLNLDERTMDFEGPGMEKDPAWVTAVSGVAHALRELLDLEQTGQLLANILQDNLQDPDGQPNVQQLFSRPRVFDETHAPLSDYFVPMAGWAFERGLGVLPPYEELRTTVCLIATRLQMTPQELVMAYTVLERLVRRCYAAIRPHCIRPMLLASCVLTLAVTGEATSHHREIERIAAAFDDSFTCLSTQHLSMLVWQMLGRLGWHVPMTVGAQVVPGLDMTYQSFANAIFSVGNMRNRTAVPVPIMEWARDDEWP